MDPFTQGALGAALPQAMAVRNKGAVALAGCFGFLAGMAPDLDVLIRSSEDPLLFLGYHRQFTHSLVFVPLGGFLAAALLHLLLSCFSFGRRLRPPFWRGYLFCTLGYGTHGLLDFATSYGTMLLWPFSEERFALSIVSIVDPLLSLPLLVLVGLAMLKRNPLYARFGLAWLCLYLLLGTIQQASAFKMARELAASRGHQIERQTVKPSFGNILVWRSVYEANGRFYVDGLRVGVAPNVYPGPSVARLVASRDFPWLVRDSRQYRDLLRFDDFSQGYAALDPAAPNAVIDVRFAFLPNELGALWSIVLLPDAGPDRHVTFQTNRRQARANLSRLWGLVVAQQD